MRPMFSFTWQDRFWIRIHFLKNNRNVL